MSLLGASGMIGFSAFLPESSPNVASGGIVALSMSRSWMNASYDAHGGRIRAVSLLQRYSYVIGQLPSIFHIN
jgi:hypothetical protein